MLIYLNRAQNYYKSSRLPNLFNFFSPHFSNTMFIQSFSLSLHCKKNKSTTNTVGRNKFSQREIDIIAKLLGRKMAGNRTQQKMVRHTLRTVFEFSIADFNVQGKAFGPSDLHDCIRRGCIHILDEATIEAMRLRHAEKKRHDETLIQAEAIADGEAVDWETVQREWNEYYAQHPDEAPLAE